MLEIVFGTVGLIGLGVALLWLIGLPADEDVEELAGLVTANWDEVETRIDSDSDSPAKAMLACRSVLTF